MSQTATLYRISKQDFEQLQQSDGTRRFDINSAKSYAMFQGSFMGIEFMLSKGRNDSTINLVNEVFNPKNILGQQYYDKLPPEQKFEFYETGQLIPYINPEVICRLNDFLNKVSESEIRSSYNAQELNDNGVYPNVWHHDNSRDKAFNERNILEGLVELKKIVCEAEKEEDFVLVFIG